MKEEAVIVFDEHGLFEIHDPMLLEIVSAGSLDLSQPSPDSTNSGCVNAVCLNGGNQACANTNFSCTWVNMRACIQATDNGVNTVCV